MTKAMHILLAPDSFKGTLTSRQVIEALTQAAAELLPTAVLTPIPIADGGEGTVEAMAAAADGQLHEQSVTGPLGEPRQACWALLPDGVCVVEMAQANGLPLVPIHRRDPRQTTTYGTGQQLAGLIRAGRRRLLLGLGGSATHDVGLGLMSALGARFLDEGGRELPPVGASLAQVAHIDLSGLEPGLAQCQLIAMCDVTNPLCGPQGAASIYGPQKGADEACVRQLDAGSAHFGRLLEQAVGRPLIDMPGAGAAGGLGAAVLALGGQLKRGIDAVLDACGFDKLLSTADLVISGEGRVDAQSVSYGKVIGGIARRCAEADVPLALIAGSLALSYEELAAAGCPAAMALVREPMALEDALAQAQPLLHDAARRLMALIALRR